MTEFLDHKLIESRKLEGVEHIQIPAQVRCHSRNQVVLTALSDALSLQICRAPLHHHHHLRARLINKAPSPPNPNGRMGGGGGAVGLLSEPHEPPLRS